jgi:hypothetical protein
MPLPEPHPGLVISYSYLWRDEARAGREEGVKDRPAVIVLAVRAKADSGRVVTVAPVTHRKPSKPGTAVELPAKVKQHLGLDTAASWVILDETNQFLWPGHDLRPLPGRPRVFSYGVLPPRLLAKITNGIAALWDQGHAPTKR